MDKRVKSYKSVEVFRATIKKKDLQNIFYQKNCFLITIETFFTPALIQRWPLLYHSYYVKMKF